MGSPSGLIGEVFMRVLGQAGDHRAGKGALAHIGQGLGIDDIIAMAGAQQFEEVAAALRLSGAKPGEVSIAHLSAKAVRSLVARPGIVDCDPGGAGEPGAQHIARLVEEAILTGDQQAHELSLGNQDAERMQQRQQPRHRDLPLMILGKHEAAQLRPKVPVDAVR